MVERTGIFHHVCRRKSISPPQTAGGSSARFCHVPVHGQHQQIRTNRRWAWAASCSRSNLSDVHSAVMAFLCRSAASLLKPYQAAPAVLSAARLYSSGVFVCLWFKLHPCLQGSVCWCCTNSCYNVKNQRHCLCDGFTFRATVYVLLVVFLHRKVFVCGA